ncbi:MAG: hypothetical protein F9K40_03095 [Kofleriaceae bacterium]|nr:MAG: hypothetical protein F9K40_03095 [Kofleriaceae bacterium]
MTATTSTSVTETINTEVIDDLVIAYAADYENAVPFFRFKSLIGEHSAVASFPRWVKDAHEDLAAETDAMTPVELETTQVSVTVARVGIARNPTNTMMEDTVLGRAGFLQAVAMDAATLLGMARDEDGTALFASAAADVTDSGNPTELLDLVEMIGSQRTQKARGAMVFHLHDHQLKHVQRAAASSTATGWERFLALDFSDPQYGGTFMNVPIFASGLNPTANGAADRVGCIWVRGDIESQKMYCAFGHAVARVPTTKTQEQILEDALLYAVTARYGVNILATNFATKLVTDNG